MDLTYISVHRSDLQGYTIDCGWRSFDDEQYIDRNHSPLGIPMGDTFDQSET
jgi:hypothetical protein